MTLNQAKVGDKVTLISLGDCPDTKERLICLGMRPGDSMEIISKAILHGPITIKSENKSFSIRYKFTKSIEVSLN